MSHSRHARSPSSRSGENARYSAAPKVGNRRGTAATQQKPPSSLGDDVVHIRTDAPSEDDDGALQRKRFADIGDRRVKEWENYRRSQRSSIDQPQSKVCIDFNIAEQYAGRVYIELMDDVVPKTVANFKALISGERGYDLATGIKLDYVDSAMSRHSKTYVTFGELSARNIAAIPDEDVPDTCIKDENFSIRHTSRGLLSMKSTGPHTSGSAFCITLDKCPELDFRQVVFGKVVEGMHVLERVEAVPATRTGVPKVPTAISFCAVLTGECPNYAYRSLEEFKVDVGGEEAMDESAHHSTGKRDSESSAPGVEPAADGARRASAKSPELRNIEDGSDAGEGHNRKHSDDSGTQERRDRRLSEDTREGTPHGSRESTGERQSEPKEDADGLQKVYFLRHCGTADDTQPPTDKDIENAELWGHLLALCRISAVFCNWSSYCVDTVKATDNNAGSTMLCEKIGVQPQLYSPEDLDNSLLAPLDTANGNVVICYADEEVEQIWQYFGEKCESVMGAKSAKQRVWWYTGGGEHAAMIMQESCALSCAPSPS